MYHIKQVSEISGVSVRTLHHYDEIGILSPQKSENGYRYYSEEDMSLLQTILFYKYLGFSLGQIRELIGKNEKDILVHLKSQLELMKKEKKKLLTLINTLEKTIDSAERSVEMSTKEKFKGFTYQENDKYTEQAKELYGREVVEESIARQKGKEQELTDGFNRIFFAFAENLENHLPATAAENVALSKQLHEHIREYSFDCSLDVFSYIGLGYAQNEEFRKNIDQFGEGVSQYISDAIQQYVSENKGE